MFKHPTHLSKTSSSREKATWLGKENERIVATSDGVRKCRTIRRLVPSEQHDATLFGIIRASPWDPKGKNVRDTDTFVVSDNNLHTSEEPSGEAAEQEP